MDQIIIKELQVFANHGVLPQEQTLGQKFLVSAILHVDTRTAARADDVSQTINYAEVCQQITIFMKEHTYQLIETAAESLAKELLHTQPKLQQVELEIKKPWAPIGLPLESASVAVNRGWREAVIALGSNMGNREAYLQGAVDELSNSTDCRVTAVSEFIETSPYGVLDQPDFLNGCLLIQTILSPFELLDFLHRIEQNACRTREKRWGPRTLDLDLIFYEQQIVDTIDLKIPHPDMHNRFFVLKPLNQIAPYYVHPLLHQPVFMLLEKLKDREECEHE